MATISDDMIRKMLRAVRMDTFNKYLFASARLTIDQKINIQKAINGRFEQFNGNTPHDLFEFKQESLGGYEWWATNISLYQKALSKAEEQVYVALRTTYDNL